MQHPLPMLLPDFSTASVLVIGDVMLDRYWFGETQRISPEAPVPVVKIGNSDNRPGGAGNVALNIAALGAKVTLLGLTGNDEAAQILDNQLAAAGVEQHLCKHDSLSTIIKLRVISRHQQLIRLDFEEKITAISHDLLTERYKKLIGKANLIILSDYQKGTLADPQTLIRIANEAGIPILVDPKSIDYNIYANADIITPNYKEFESVVGPCTSEQEILEKGRQLLTQYNIKSLLITRGEHGMTLVQPETSAHLPAYAREVFDVTGAGDTVIGVLGAAVAANVSLLQATAVANLAASLAVGKLGAATVTQAELQVALTGKTSYANGIVNDEQLLQAVKEARAQGKKIVFTNGCFDILHAGHVTYLQMAKQLGDFLVVGINEDESITKLKGAGRPFNNLEHRMTVLAGLSAVDWVIPFADDTPERLLRLIQPDLLVKGGDYRLDQIVGADIVRSYGGDVRIMNHTITTNSTALINNLHLSANEEAEHYG